jgi:hypothetical protein
MQVLVEGQWSIYQSHLRQAKAEEKEAKASKDKSEKGPAKHRRRHQKRQTTHENQAQDSKARGERKAKEFGKEAAQAFRSGEGVRDVRKRADANKLGGCIGQFP